MLAITYFSMFCTEAFIRVLNVLHQQPEFQMRFEVHAVPLNAVTCKVIPLPSSLYQDMDVRLSLLIWLPAIIVTTVLTNIDKSETVV